MSSTQSDFPDVQRVIEAILKLTNYGSAPTTYQELSAELHLRTPRSTELSAALDSVQAYCVERGFPSLAVMVGHSGDQRKMPGNGFFVSYVTHYFEDSSFRSCIVENERERVKRAADWKDLLMD